MSVVCVVCLRIVFSKATLQKRGSMEPNEPLLDLPLVLVSVHPSRIQTGSPPLGSWSTRSVVSGREWLPGHWRLRWKWLPYEWVYALLQNWWAVIFQINMTSNNGPSKKRTTFVQWTAHLFPIDITIELEPPRSGHLPTPNKGYWDIGSPGNMHTWLWSDLHHNSLSRWQDGM